MNPNQYILWTVYIIPNLKIYATKASEMFCIEHCEDSTNAVRRHLDRIINNLPGKPEPKERQSIQERLTAGREALRS